jgi:uncharacterized RDD family membrane protein YckC
VQVPAQATVGVGLRFLAILIDAVVVTLALCPFIILAVASSDAEAGETSSGASLLLNCLSFLIGIGYYVVLEALRGQTVGKMALGIRVVKLDGSPISWQESIIRNLLRIIDGLFAYLVAAILIWTSPMKQRLGDRAANTVVVRKDMVGELSSPVARF